jgi:hypothetical protein
MRRNRNRSGGNSSKNIVQPQNVLSRQNSWQAGEQTLENQIKQQTDKEVISQYLEAFTVLFGRVNSILAGRQIKCELSNNNALAFTDGNTIFFRFDNLETAFKAYVNRQRNSMVGNTLAQNKLMDRLGQLRGLNYHELAHCLFTPKRTSSLLKMLSEEVKTTTNSSVSAHLPKIFNLLEDARIESLFVAKYPASQYFFTDAVMKYIANNPSTFSFLLMDGRKYLPLELRKAFREALIASQSISEKDLDLLSDLNDTYRSLSLTPSACKKGNEDKIAFEICKKYLAILERNNILEECAKHGDDNVGGHSQHTNTKTDSEVEELHEIRQEQEEEFDSEDSEDSEDSKDSGDSDDSDDSILMILKGQAILMTIPKILMIQMIQIVQVALMILMMILMILMMVLIIQEVCQKKTLLQVNQNCLKKTKYLPKFFKATRSLFNKKWQMCFHKSHRLLKQQNTTSCFQNVENQAILHKHQLLIVH